MQVQLVRNRRWSQHSSCVTYKMESKYYLRTTTVLRIWIQVEELDMEKLRSQNRIEMRNMAGDSAAAALTREQPVDAYEQVDRLKLSQNMYITWSQRTENRNCFPGLHSKHPALTSHIMYGSYFTSSTTKEHLKKMAMKTHPCPWKA